MNMFVRIYYEGRCKDIPLGVLHNYSIGSGDLDDLKISTADLNEKHIVIAKTPGGYEMKCNGDVYFGKNRINNATLSPNQFYILSMKHKISMFIIAEYESKGTSINLDSVNTLTIGRNKENNIVLSSPIVSGQHARICKFENEYHIQDLQSMNGTYVNGIATANAKLNEGTEIIIGDLKLIYTNNSIIVLGLKNNAVLRDTQSQKTQEKAKEKSGTLFKRSPRLKLDVPTGEINIEAVPPLGSKPELDKLGMILPMLTTLALSGVMTLVMGNAMMLLYTAPMHLISGIMSYRNYKKQTSKYADTEKLRLQKYNNYIDSVIEEIESKRDDQISALTLANPETSACFNIAKKLDRRLWERKPTDSDFMTVRVGSGTLDFSMRIKTPPKGAVTLVEDELAKKPAELHEKYNKVNNLPIVCPITRWSTCGVVGNRNDGLHLVNNMITQIATHHCYTEVKLVVIYNEKTTNEFNWLSSLPHLHDDEKTICYVAKNKESASELFNAIEPSLKERVRDAEKEAAGKHTLKIPYYLFVISEPSYMEGETITRYIYRYNKQIGVGAILLYDTLDLLPKECNFIIEANSRQGKIYPTSDASAKQEFTFDASNNSDFVNFGKSLSNVYCNDLVGDAEIIEKITMYEMLGIKSAEEIDLKKRWSSANVMKTLTAPIGVKEKNERIYLDLHEDAHGPHGLVAGTTGSGKSETLQTYILSTAITYHPYEVGFVIIDFKGGGMANQFEDLPHLIGAITDMDGKEIDRSLLSIKAELDKRKRLFSEANVSKIDQYIELFKSGVAKTPLPHLIIVVDEFAELKADQPEFMQELISAARIGRSLGVHLILATQKPAGQVNEQIWSNSNFKLCLKVRDESDSMEVLKSPLAAKIKKTGRGYLKVGNDEIFDLFQSGFSGAKISAKDGTKSTELNEIVKHIKGYCEKEGIKKLTPICLPSLPKVIPYDEKLITEGYQQDKIPVGIYDNPSCQEQGIAYLDIEQNTFVLGSAQTGKTNLIQNIIRTASSKYTPKELNIYIMDFASRVLKTFETLNHVGGVVTSEEDEKLKNMFKLLNEELEYRKKKTTEVGASSFAAYLQGGYKDMARIVLILDNFAVYKELYGDEYETDFIRLCREGLTYGISVIVTNSTTSGFGYKYLSLFANRIAFYCNDSGEYSNVFDKCRMSPSNIPGNALYNDDGMLLEAKIFMSFEGTIEIERTNSAKEHIKETNAKNPDLYAKKIPCIPDELTLNYINQNYNYNPKTCEYIIGLDYSTVDVVSLKTDKMNELSIVGKNPERNLEISNVLLEQFTTNAIDNPVKIYIIDSIERPLKKFSDHGSVEEYTIDYVEIGTIVDDISDIIEDRYDILLNESIEALEKYPLICVFVNNKDAIEYISSTKDVCETYKQMLKKAKALKVLFVYSDLEDTSVSFGAPEILKKQKDIKNAFITDNLKEVQFFDIPPNISRNAKVLQSGDVFYLNDASVQRIKLVEE